MDGRQVDPGSAVPSPGRAEPWTVEPSHSSGDDIWRSLIRPVRVPGHPVLGWRRMAAPDERILHETAPATRRWDPHFAPGGWCPCRRHAHWRDECKAAPPAAIRQPAKSSRAFWGKSALASGYQNLLFSAMWNSTLKTRTAIGGHFSFSAAGHCRTVADDCVSQVDCAWLMPLDSVYRKLELEAKQVCSMVVRCHLRGEPCCQPFPSYACRRGPAHLRVWSQFPERREARRVLWSSPHLPFQVQPRTAL